ncbi:MAG: hypothetical protein GKS00_25110 [Alphaproteobacteria bacterium]|nr:hypothetical protein [Alphaproteobacteria bacterium]
MKQLGFVRISSAVAAFALFAMPLAVSAAEKSLGVFKGWEAYSFEESGKTVCVVWGKPAKSEGKYKKRGDIRMFIAHRAWARPKRVNEVSFESGYTFKKDGEAAISVDGKKFALFTDGDTAWNRSAQDDAAMTRAMRVGKSMIVQGVSSRGTKTKDTYSLFGFTAAHNAINKACKVK